MNYDDAFTLEKVSESLLDKFNFVAGIVPVLTTHLSQVSHVTIMCTAYDTLLMPVQCGVSSSPLTSQEAFYVASALTDLAHYISSHSNEREIKDRQKLLRNLRILEMIISILGLFKCDAVDQR